MTASEPRPVSNFSVTAWPGPGSTTFPQEVRPGEYGLVLRLGTVDIMIIQAPGQPGAVEFARWCRQLSRVAAHVATEVEQTARTAAMPRHYAEEQSDQDGDTRGGDRGW